VTNYKSSDIVLEQHVRRDAGSVVTVETVLKEKLSCFVMVSYTFILFISAQTLATGAK
jgi:hypothetical protein